MMIGNQSSFAIECHHEPLPNLTRRVFGRMCLWVGGVALGDIDEPACMLNVTEGVLANKLARLGDLDDPSLHGLSDRETFEFLDRVLYRDYGQSTEQLAEDSKRYFRFDFLTNGGEAFDRTQSFIRTEGDRVVLMFKNDANEFHSLRVPLETFLPVIRDFLQWLSDEGRGLA